MAAAFFLNPWCHSEPIAGVPLTVVRDNTNTIVSWPYPSTGFGLEFSTNLSTTNWQPAAETSVSNSLRWGLTAPVSPPSRFFRLKNHLQHFGFWAGSVAAGGSIIEQRGFVNFTMGAGPGPSADQAVALGMKLMFFAPDFTDPNVQDQLDAIRPYATNMLAFFTMDEPDCVAGGNNARLDQLLASIESQISQLKLSFPDVPAMMTVGCAFWSYSNFRIPRGIDYIAVESYGSSGNPGTTRTEWMSKLRLLKSYMNSSQRIFLMPGATEGYGTESQLIQKANDIYTYAQTDPLVVGVFPFDWYSDNYDCASAGVFCGNGVPTTNYSIKVIGNRSARDLPNLRARYTQIGQSIMNGAFLDVGAGGPWIQFLGGPSLPGSPWISSQSGGTGGTTLIADFFDPDLGATNQALRINSGANANEWYVGPLALDELAVGARFRLVAFSPTGKENLLCLTTHSTPLSPAPAITLVNGHYKLWNYVNSDTGLMDLGPAVTNAWHTAYLYARNDGKVRLWWDGNLVFDDLAPLVNPFNGYVEWGSGAWQFDAMTTVDFDWVAYGNNF
ncbi:MAG: hypothetical protein DME23_02075 [Verrucomicrobia bacterium]|nr:MAG: hypothetical protein DME23_02075 [Verrucomicrobiota bacterium]